MTKDKPAVLLEHHLKRLKLPRYGTILQRYLTIVRPSSGSTRTGRGSVRRWSGGCRRRGWPSSAARRRRTTEPFS